ncbi:MAG TPA: hypothetical protein VM911_21535 [Pyrinomonadaceae bacterium]|jgi:hypothetical protein|nr:hypothetical protein [Pyrinomonadaceae bacterium]
MVRAIFVVAFILTCTLTALSQRVTGTSSWRGRVESVNESTREITITSLDKKQKSFTGRLDEDFQAMLLDNSVTQPPVSEIPIGMRVRVFYRTKDERIGDRKVKVNHIYGVLFIGRDEFDRLRVRLNVSPSTVVTLKESGGLTASNPLKLHFFFDAPRSPDDLINWINQWNAGEANTYGRIETVSDLSQADISLVVYNTTMEIPGVGESEGDAMTLPSAVVFLVAPKSGGLDVLWKHTPLVSFPNNPGLIKSITKEIEKRMKARSQPQGK